MIATNYSIVPPLADIDQVEKFSVADKPLFAELYQVLQKHNALNRFGVTLLHSHFELAEDEVLLETTNKKTRKQTIEPISINKLAEIATVETSWRLDANGVQPVFRCQIEQTSKPPQHVDRP